MLVPVVELIQGRELEGRVTMAGLLGLVLEELVRGRCRGGLQWWLMLQLIFLGCGCSRGGPSGERWHYGGQRERQRRAGEGAVVVVGGRGRDTGQADELADRGVGAV